MITRRGLLGTGLALLAAPAIVRAASIMPVKVWRPASQPVWVWVAGDDPRRHLAPWKRQLADIAPYQAAVPGEAYFVGDVVVRDPATGLLRHLSRDTARWPIVGVVMKAEIPS